MIAKCLIISFTFNFSSSCPWASPSIVFRLVMSYTALILNLLLKQKKKKSENFLNCVQFLKCRLILCSPLHPIDLLNVLFPTVLSASSEEELGFSIYFPLYLAKKPTRRQWHKQAFDNSLFSPFLAHSKRNSRKAEFQH